MDGFVIKPRRETCITDEQLFALYKDAYSQWSDAGIESSWRDFTQEDFEHLSRYAAKASVFVAIDKDTGELLGAHTLRANKRTRVVNTSALAVASKAKGHGIASALLRFEADRARKAGFRYFRDSTATNATWSVNWHLKNGYRIVGYKRSETDNHPSYVFRLQLQPSILWSGPLAPITARVCYLCSYIVTNLIKDSKGRFNVLGRIAKFFLRRNFL
jgi:GNAT superfamily N-acetyltransferase